MGSETGRSGGEWGENGTGDGEKEKREERGRWVGRREEKREGGLEKGEEEKERRSGVGGSVWALIPHRRVGTGSNRLGRWAFKGAPC